MNRSTPAYRLHVLFLVAVFSGLPASQNFAQSSFSNDSHWDPQFGPPARFLNPYNVEATNDYVLVTGRQYKPNGLEKTFGTVYRSVLDTETYTLDIPGWEEATLVAGTTRIYAMRGRYNADVAELNLQDRQAHLILDPPGMIPQFTTFGDTLFALTETGVYRWNDTWERLGPPLDFPVYEWLVGPSGVFVSGNQAAICDLQTCYTSLWHLADETWKLIGLATGGGNPKVSAISIDSRGRFIIAGDFTSINGKATPRVARWDGNEWSALGTGFGDEIGFISALVAVDTLVYAAATNNYVLEWNDRAWHTLGEQPDRSVRKFVTRNGRLYASGWFTAIGNTAAYRIAEWDFIEQRWLPLFPVQGSGIDGEVYTLTVGPEGYLYAGGRFGAAGASPARNLARWDGSKWSNIGEGLDAPVRALATHTDRLYAGTYEGVAMTNLQERSWTYLPDLPDGKQFQSIADLIFLQDTLYALGTVDDGTAKTNGVFRWQNNQWQTIGEFRRDGHRGHAYALTAAEHRMLYVAGFFTHVNSVPVRNIARWDGTEWHALGNGLENPVYALETGGGKVFVGGGSPDSLLYAWDPAQALWSHIPFPDYNHFGCEPLVHALHWRPDGLYAGFGAICLTTHPPKTQKMYTLARWNGWSWRIPGSGIGYGGVGAMASSGDDLYVAGSFERAGVVASSNIARWNAAVRLPITEHEVPSAIRLDQNYPNPFNQSTTLRFSLERPANQVRLGIYDLLGRRVASLINKPLQAGTHEVAFDADGIMKGVYLYRLSINGRAWSRKMLVH